MSSPTKYKLYDSTGISLVYIFNNVINIDPPIKDDSVSFVTHSGLRGNGDITIDGSEPSYSLSITIVLQASGSTDKEKYENLISQLDAIKTAIPVKTKFLLKIEKQESPSSTDDIKVKRYLKIDSPVPTSGQKVLNYWEVTINFIANSY